MSTVSVIIVNKDGELNELNIKKYDRDDLYKKCGFKKNEHFSCQHTWTVNLDNASHIIALYAKDVGKANTENKYEFPPPVDKALYYGKCALVQMDKDKNDINLDLSTWEKIYEKLFGGFEDITAVAQLDDDEEDELDDVPSNMKTKTGGYLKDGFVVDNESGDDEEDDEDEEYNTTDNNTNDTTSKYCTDEDDDEDEFGDQGSELSEEEYIFTDDE